MKKLVFSIWIIPLAFCSIAQSQGPIFESLQDSIAFEKVQQSLKDFREKIYTKTNALWEPKKSMDSLQALYSEILSRRLGWRYNYTPTSDFTSFDDLMNGLIQPETVTRLSLANYKGKRLPPEVMKCQNLSVLELVNTSIDKIDRQLNSLSGLTALHIYNNRSNGPLKSGRNKHITHLKIRGEKPDKLPKNYKNFRALDSLDLQRNLLTEFPNVYRNKKLRKLELSENNLTLKNLKAKRNKNLESLFVRHNKIEVVPGTLGKFTGLIKLTLNFNSIQEVEPGVAKLQNLEQLSFYKNKLEKVPDVIYRLTSLKEVDLYYNRIKTLSDEVRNLKNLNILYLSFNEMSGLPESIGELKKLQALYIHNNLLRWLPESIGNLEGLKILRMNNNGLMVFPAATLKIKGLEALDISYNSLYSIPLELSSHLPNLKSLTMMENPWENNEQILLLAQRLREKGTDVRLNSYKIVIE